MTEKSTAYITYVRTRCTTTAGKATESGEGQHQKSCDLHVGTCSGKQILLTMSRSKHARKRTADGCLWETEGGSTHARQYIASPDALMQAIQ
jgi:hypothetical protein